MNSNRIVMSRQLERRDLSLDDRCQRVNREDREDLATLLYAAYRGTIDDDGETYSDALDEIDNLFAGAYGDYLADCSFCIRDGEFIASASLITWWSPHDAPLIAFTMTRPEMRRTGHAKTLIQASMNALLDRGYDRLTLVVTDGNVPAQRLYAELGFEEVPDT